MRLHRGRCLPLVLHRLVAADVHVRAGEQVDHFGQDAFEKLQRFLARVEQVGVHAPVVRRLGGAIDHAVLRIRRHCRLGVAGHVDFRNDGDMAGRGVGHHVAYLFLRVMAAVPVGGAVGVAPGVALRHAAAADLGEPGVALDLDAPALVIGEMPMEGVELVRGHRVEQGLDLLHTPEMPRRVEHQPAPGEARRVLDPHRRQRHHHRLRPGKQLPQRHRAIEQSMFVAGFDADAVIVDVQRVGLRRRAGLRGNDAEIDAIAFALATGQPQRRGPAQQFGEARGHPAGGVALGAEGRGRIDHETTLGRPHHGRQWNQRHSLDLGGRHRRERCSGRCRRAAGGHGKRREQGGRHQRGGGSVSDHHDSLELGGCVAVGACVRAPGHGMRTAGRHCKKKGPGKAPGPLEEKERNRDSAPVPRP